MPERAVYSRTDRLRDREERKRVQKMKKNNRRPVKALALLLLLVLLICGALSACKTAETLAPEDGAAALSDEQLAQRAADIMFTAFGVEVVAEDLIIPEDVGLGPIISITASGPTEEGEARRYCHVFINRETGAFESANRDLPLPVKSADEEPPTAETDAQTDKKKLAKTALEKLAAITGVAPKAYFLDGAEALFDANDSIATDCHILLTNGDYYVVSVVYPGYALHSIYRAPPDEPFVDIDSLTEDSFGGEWGIF